MLWKNIILKKNKSAENLNLFLLTVKLSFKTVAQISYKDEYENVKIVRFYDKFWSREIIRFTDNPDEICFKFFAHTPNLKKDEHVVLSIEFENRVIKTKEFIVNKQEDFTGWFELY